MQSSGAPRSAGFGSWYLLGVCLAQTCSTSWLQSLEENEYIDKIEDSLQLLPCVAFPGQQVRCG